MIDIDVAKGLMVAVDHGFDEQVAFTQQLVKFPTTRGSEQTAQDFMATELRRRGYGVDRWRIDVADIENLPGYSIVDTSYENTINVVGAHRADTVKGKSLILNGHIDVVPAGPLDMWNTPPFEPLIDDGWMHGRGAGDMKSGLVAAVFAMDAITRAGYRPTADVFVESVVEEECTGNGALACLQRGYRADAALIPEPRGESLLSAQLGVMWFQVSVRGRPVHAQRASEAANAIECAFELIQALKRLEAKWNAEKKDHPDFADHPHPVNFNLGKIQGGDWASSVPAWCVFDMRVGVYPGDDLDARRAEIATCIEEAAAANPFLRTTPPVIRYNGFLAEGYRLVDAGAAEQALGAAHTAVRGDALQREAITATTDARFFGLYGGMPALVYGPHAENIHGFDERVDLESVRRTTQTIALFIAEWCGLEGG
jgi:acetylornithine deacetylase